MLPPIMFPSFKKEEKKEENTKLKEQQTELERRIAALTACLEEKVLENNVLHKQVDEFTKNDSPHPRKEVKEMPEPTKSIQESNKAEPIQKTERTVKIIEADDEKFKEKEELEWGEKYKREKKDRQRMEDLVFKHEETIEKLKQALMHREKKNKIIETEIN